MIDKDLDLVLHEVSSALGLQLELKEMPAGDLHTFSLRVTGLHKPIGFEFRVRESLLSWTIDLYLDTFSGDLLRVMNGAYQEHQDSVGAVLASASSLQLEAQLNLNEIPFGNLTEDYDWKILELRVRGRFSI